MARTARLTAAAAAGQHAARDALRSVTGPIHEELHRIPVLHRLAEGTITREEYGDLLEEMLLFHGTVERCLSAGPSLAGYGIHLAERARAPMLRLDLRALGRSVPENDCASNGPLPIPRSPAAALGMLYVTEGATLGGRILARTLDHLLGQEDEGRLFLLGHGERNGPLWRGLCTAIEACGRTPGDRATMASAALRSFEWFRTLMDAAERRLVPQETMS